MDNAGTVLTRLAAAAGQLGIDLSTLQPALSRLGNAPAKGAVVWIDADGERIGVGCRLAGTLGFVGPDRPGDAWVELETSPAGRLAERILILGARPLAEDLAVLAAEGVSAAAREELAARLVRIGGATSDGLGRRTEADQTKWSVVRELGGTPSEVMQTLAPLLALADELGVPPLQRRLLEQAHLALTLPAGCRITLACDAARALPQLALAYQGVYWKQAVGLTDALRPGSPCAPRLGVLAGAFGTDSAALELTFRAGAPAWVRISVAPPIG